MTCALNFVHKALSSGLTHGIGILNEVGTTQSISSFELEIITWVTAYSIYSEMESYHNVTGGEYGDESYILGKLNLYRHSENGKKIVEKSKDLVFDSAQSVFDTLHEEVGKGVLIPRVRNHLELKVVDLQFIMDNHHDVIKILSGENSTHDCASKLRGIQLSDKDWLIDWLSKRLDQRDLLEMKSILSSG